MHTELTKTLAELLNEDHELGPLEGTATIACTRRLSCTLLTLGQWEC